MDLIEPVGTGAAPVRSAVVRPSDFTTALACLRLLRPEQWIKNAFIAGPLLFAGELSNVRSVVAIGWTVLSFSLISSAVYVLNDLVDREKDRLHPVKRMRPLASGAVSETVAMWLAVACCLLGVSAAAHGANGIVLALEAVYFATNVGYTFWFKHMVLLDVMTIALGFVLRVLAGAYALHVPASHWLLLCTFFLALFLGFGKRENELAAVPPGARRAVLSLYSGKLVADLNLFALTATIMSYALYTVAPETVAKFGTDKLVYSVPIVAYGLMRYLFLMRVRAAGGDPARALLTDRPIWSCIGVWAVFCAAVIHLLK